ncbi:probable pre-mRNA-splicing factor ATP-dependent RNA helicase DEAH4 [Tanacetum coccineum]
MKPDLPILQFEEKILATVNENPVVVIIGETGSGKSTQLSQILLRNGYTNSGIIAVTQLFILLVIRNILMVVVCKRLIKFRAANLKSFEILCSAEQPKSYIESSLRKAIDIHVNEPQGDILIFMTGQDDIEKLVSRLEEKIQSLEIRVFSPPPKDCRRIIVATNIAETSLTVDGVVAGCIEYPNNVLCFHLSVLASGEDDIDYENYFA